jgi:hypothetical protein
MSFISSLAGGILGAGAANDAAAVESQAAKKAQDLSKSNQTDAINMQQGVWSGTQAAEQPYQELGATSANHLRDLLSGGFKAPTLAEAEQTPGFKFNMEQGTRAIDQNAAANGTLMSGNTGTALEKFGTGLAENTYQQDYNNALNSYMANYSTLKGGTDTGLSSTGQLGQFGQDAATNTGRIDLTAADQQMQQINNAAAARASGYLGSAKAWGTAAGGMAAGVDNLDLSGGSSLFENAQNLLMA